MSRRPGRDPYRRKSNLGFMLVMVGVVLLFGGHIGALWPVLLIGLYLSWVLRTPPPKPIAPPSGFDTVDVRKAIDQEIHAVSGRVPPEVLAKVQSIRRIILEILPRVHALPLGSPESFVVERTATDYLPTALESYLTLPRVYATQQRVQDGKTPTQVLMDQLTLLESKMNEVADHVHHVDADRLLANGRFLEERFGRSALSLDRSDPGRS